MAQQGQVFKLKTRGAHGKPTWAYRYRVDGRGSARPQVGGFATQGEALQALQVALERLQRRNGRFSTHAGNTRKSVPSSRGRRSTRSPSTSALPTGR
jgi:hypothetical protein